MSFICSVCRELLTCYSDCESEDCPLEASGDPKNIHRIVSTKCGHLYHFNCLQNWLMQDMASSLFGKCPNCGTEVDIGDCWKIYPSGDEETQDLEIVIKEVKDTKKQLEKSSLAVDILQFELNAKCEEERKLRDENSKMKKIIGDDVKVKLDLLTLVEKCEEIFQEGGSLSEK